MKGRSRGSRGAVSSDENDDQVLLLAWCQDRVLQPHDDHSPRIKEGFGQGESPHLQCYTVHVPNTLRISRMWQYGVICVQKVDASLALPVATIRLSMEGDNSL